MSPVPLSPGGAEGRGSVGRAVLGSFHIWQLALVRSSLSPALPVPPRVSSFLLRLRIVSSPPPHPQPLARPSRPHFQQLSSPRAGGRQIICVNLNPATSFKWRGGGRGGGGGGWLRRRRRGGGGRQQQQNPPPKHKDKRTLIRNK